MQPDQQQRIMGYFIEEAKDHLNTIEQGLLNLQGTLKDPEMVNEVFRAAHSVKGGAAMLGLNSIQRVGHRLEDSFKLLKEAPIKVDQKLENLLFKAFDALQELLIQLQGPFGLTEEASNTILANVEPTFAELEQHLNQLAGAAASTPQPEPVAPPAISDYTLPTHQLDEALAQLFRGDVPTRLRDMLQLFKQPEADGVTRQQLQEICRSLSSIGEQYELHSWCHLIETARRAIAHSDNSYRILAPIVIKDIKLAQELVLAEREADIAPCTQLQELVPVARTVEPVETTVQDNLDDLLAGLTEEELQGSAAIDLPFEQPVASTFDFGTEFNTTLIEADDIHQGPEVGLEELNSLADLFEGEVPELGLTWQQEEVVGDEAELLAAEAGLSDPEAGGDFSDLLFDEPTTYVSGTSTDDDLSDLLEDDLSDLLEDDLIEQSTPDSSSTGELRSDESGLDDFEDLLQISSPQPAASDPSLDLNAIALETSAPSSTLSDSFDTEASETGEFGNLNELFDGLNEAELTTSQQPSFTPVADPWDENIPEASMALDDLSLNLPETSTALEDLSLDDFDLTEASPEPSETNAFDLNDLAGSESPDPLETVDTASDLESLLAVDDSFDLFATTDSSEERVDADATPAIADLDADTPSLAVGVPDPWDEDNDANAAANLPLAASETPDASDLEATSLDELDLADLGFDITTEDLFDPSTSQEPTSDEDLFDLSTSQEPTSDAEAIAQPVVKSPDLSAIDDLFGDDGSTLDPLGTWLQSPDDGEPDQSISDLDLETGENDVTIDHSLDAANEIEDLFGEPASDSDTSLDLDSLDLDDLGLDDGLAISQPLLSDDQAEPERSPDSDILLSLDGAASGLEADIALSDALLDALSTGGETSVDAETIDQTSSHQSDSDWSEAFESSNDSLTDLDAVLNFSIADESELALDDLIAADAVVIAVESDADELALDGLELLNDLNLESDDSLFADELADETLPDFDLASELSSLEHESLDLSESAIDLFGDEDLEVATPTDGFDEPSDLLDVPELQATDNLAESIDSPQAAPTIELNDLDDLTSQPATDDEFGDLDDLLGDQFEATDASANVEGFDELDDLLGEATTSATIAPADRNFEDLDAFLSENTPTDTFADLDVLLGDDVSIPANAEIASLLEQTAEVDAGESDNFSDLEALLGEDEPETIAPEVATADISFGSDSEFDDLDDLLKDAEERMGGTPSIKAGRGSITQPRRTARPGRVFSEQTMRVPVKHLDNLSNLVGELVVNRNSLEQDQERLRQSLDNLLYQVQQLSDVGQRMQDLYERSLLESSLLASRQGHRVSMLSVGSRETTVVESETTSSTGIEYDPLEMDRFTGFHSLSQEMIELIVRVRESSSDIEFIVDETEQVTRMFRQVTTQLQEGLTRSRMVPFAQAADRLPRAVRDISIKVGKQAELVIEGRETLIDKMILEQLYDPMTHLVNNAITHGIESPEVRLAAGKPASGRIVVRAFHQGNQTVISVSDDGAGIDINRVKSKAVEKGLITPAEARTISRLDVYDILFHPGFSTKDQADDFSGRGVGMDVVRTSLSDIRGVINTDSNSGKGTTFTIRLPLTLSISKALCCISDRARIAFPMDGVEDMLDLPKDRIQTNSEGQPCIAWRDAVLPVRPLEELLGYNRHLSRGTVYGGNQEDDIVSVVVLRSAGNFLALQVDQVLGEQEIVIKQLEGPVPKPIGVAGATVLGDGRIMPIADVLELIDLSMGRIRRDAGGSLWEQDGVTPIAEAPVAKTEPMVLIVDDSITVRELLSMTFNKVGYRVEQARDGQEAWEKLRSGLPCDIVFCDIEMPRMDGLELLSRIQKDSNLKQLPIAMLTSRGADRHRQMAATLGASGYFTKPYLEEALLDAAQRMLKGERLLGS